MKARQVLACGLFLAALIAAMGGGGGCRRGDRQVVAKVSDRVVTRGEFDRQFNRMEIPEGADPDSMRGRCLESMIQKELLVLEARSRGLFEPDSVIDKGVEQFATRLLRNRIQAETGKIDSTITDADVQEAFKLSLDEIQCRHILHWSKATLDSARKRIEGGETFATVAAEVSHDRKSGQEGGLLPWLNRLQLPREFRNATDTLAMGRVIGPFQSVYGWHLAMMEGRRQREGADMDVERDKIVSEILSQRKQDREQEARDEWRQRYHLEMDEPAITNMAAEATAAISAAAADTAYRGKLLAEAWVPADPNRVLARFDKGQFVVEDFRRLLVTDPPIFVGRRLTAQGSIGTILELFYNEAQLKEARRLRYDRDPEYKRQVDLKREELVVERLYSEQIMSGAAPTEAEERAYFEEHPEHFQTMPRFRYSYITVDDAAAAEALVEELPKHHGAAGFDKMVAEVRESGHVRASARDTGFLDGNQCGAVGNAALGLKPGEVGHVVELDGTHTVFRLIQVQPQGQETFENSRERVRRTLMNIQSEERLGALLKDLERKFAVKRYPERLAPAG
jgi:parvulin-like peptidyl-prolyl isomerase